MRPVRRIETFELHTGTVLCAVVVVLAVVGGFSILSVARRSFTYMAIGTLLALAIDPVVVAAARRLRVGRGAALALVLSVVITGMTLAVVLLGPPAIRQATQFGHDLPKVTARLGELPIVGDRLKSAHVQAKLNDWLNALPHRLGNDPQPIATALKAVLGGLLGIFATLIIAISILVDGRRLLGVARRVVPAERRALFDRAGWLFYETVGRYFAGSLLLASLTGLMMLLAGLVLGVPLAPVAGVWAAVTNLIPQIGGFLGGSVFVLLGFTKSPLTGVGCLAYFLIWQQIENHVLNPTIVGQAVDLTPPVTMVAALIGGSAAGVPGALVAVPLVGAAKAIWLELGRPARPAGERRGGGPLTRLRRRMARGLGTSLGPDVPSGG